MTGAGSAEVAYVKEDSFNTLPGVPTWRQPFENITIGTASLSNALRRARQPDDPRPDGSVEGNNEGAYTITGTMTDTNFHELIFPESSNSSLATSASLAPTATWYLSADTLPGTEERFLSGAAVESVAWNYQQGEDFTVELTCIVADEPEVGGSHGSAPSSISQPSKSEMVRHNGISFSLDSNTISLLQSLTVEITGMARFRRGPSRTPNDAVVGAYQPSMTVQAITEDNNQLQLTYGSSSATTTEETVSEVSATLTVDNPGGNLATYNLNRAQANDTDWQDLVNGETDLTDPTTYHLQEVAVA